jgi:hypothetical protein
MSPADRYFAVSFATADPPARASAGSLATGEARRFPPIAPGRQDDRPGRSEAIRRLVEIGLKAKNSNGITLVAGQDGAD